MKKLIYFFFFVIFYQSNNAMKPASSITNLSDEQENSLNTLLVNSQEHTNIDSEEYTKALATSLLHTKFGFDNKDRLHSVLPHLHNKISHLKDSTQETHRRTIQEILLIHRNVQSKAQQIQFSQSIDDLIVESIQDAFEGEQRKRWATVITFSIGGFITAASLLSYSLLSLWK